MRTEIIAALAVREERFELAGKTLVARELASAADVAAFADNEDLAYKLLVRCVFTEAGEPVFTDEDIPALKASAKSRLAPATRAVNRVNGFDVEDSVKNSAAAPA